MMDSGQVDEAREVSGQLTYLAGVLGLLYQKPQTFLKGLDSTDESTSSLRSEWITQLIRERSTARERGDWERADKIRIELSDKGVVLEDRSDGTTSWRLDRIYTRE